MELTARNKMIYTDTVNDRINALGVYLKIQTFRGGGGVYSRGRLFARAFIRNVRLFQNAKI